MSEPFVGEIRMFGFNFAPVGWALCDGELVSISQNEALFSLLGTTYGGDGTTNFALPNLQGRAAVHVGQGTSSTYILGEEGGVETVTLGLAQLASHDHAPAAQSATGTSPTPVDNFWAGSAVNQYGSTATATMDPATIGANGGGQPHENRSPYLAVNYCIALFGVFPSRG